MLLHGLKMDASPWDGLTADLAADHRCVAPTLPLGAHRHAMRADADLLLPGIASLVVEFDNFPPRLTGLTLLLPGKLPPRMFGLFMQQMRIRAVRRPPIAFGRLTQRGDAATAR